MDAAVEKNASKGTIWQRFRAALAGDTRPVAVALAIALGIFFGCSPFYGAQTLLVLGFAAVLRLNPLLAVLGSQVSFPPLGVAIVSSEVALGEWLRFGRWGWPRAATGAELAKWLWGHALYSWALGSAIIGGGLALVGGLVAFGAATFLRSRRPRAA
ncbi:MAG: DUF2062 domain-containing protein [Myxococcales bacterium]